VTLSKLLIGVFLLKGTHERV